MRLARWVSIASHPFVMIGLLVGVAAAERSAGAAASIGLVAGFTVLPLLILMIRQVRHGAWENADASNKAERPALYGVGLGGLALLLMFLKWSQPGSFLIRGVLLALAMFAVCGVATRWVKVSLHMAFGTFAAVALVLGNSRVGWALVMLLPLIAWSRLVLGRHRDVEIAVGILIGAAAGIGLHVI